MGKDKEGAKRLIKRPKMQARSQNRENLLGELAKQWSASQPLPLTANLEEDGYVFAVIESPFVRTTIICKGIAREGNTYGYLTQLLRAKELVPNKGSCGEFYVQAGTTWTKVDPLKDLFRSGDYLMLLTRGEGEIKKAIKKSRAKGQNKLPKSFI